jgi:uncharacterized protein YbcI
VVEYFRVFRHVGFFALLVTSNAIEEVSKLPARTNTMNDSDSEMAQQVARVATAYQTEWTGHAPASVAVVLSEDTLVITLRDALTPAEKALALSPSGAAQVQEFHRQLFLSSADGLRKEIKRITGREVREAAAQVEPASGTVVHAFTTGNVVQVFSLENQLQVDAVSDNGANTA